MHTGTSSKAHILLSDLFSSATGLITGASCAAVAMTGRSELLAIPCITSGVILLTAEMLGALGGSDEKKQMLLQHLQAAAVSGITCTAVTMTTTALAL